MLYGVSTLHTTGEGNGYRYPIYARRTDQVKKAKGPTPPSGEMEPAILIHPIRAVANRRGDPLLFGVGYFSAFDLSTSLTGWPGNGEKNEGPTKTPLTNRCMRLMVGTNQVTNC